MSALSPPGWPRSRRAQAPATRRPALRTESPTPALGQYRPVEPNGIQPRTVPVSGGGAYRVWTRPRLRPQVRRARWEASHFARKSAGAAEGADFPHGRADDRRTPSGGRLPPVCADRSGRHGPRARSAVRCRRGLGPGPASRAGGRTTSGPRRPGPDRVGTPVLVGPAGLLGDGHRHLVVGRLCVGRLRPAAPDPGAEPGSCRDPMSDLRARSCVERWHRPGARRRPRSRTSWCPRPTCGTTSFTRALTSASSAQPGASTSGWRPAATRGAT